MNITVITDQPNNNIFDLNNHNDFGFNIKTHKSSTYFQADSSTDVFIVDYSGSKRIDFATTRELRNKSNGGIIMIGPEASADDLIIALEMGADEFITPPINYRELSARIRNLGRWSRLSHSGNSDEESKATKENSIIRFSDWELNTIRQVLKSPSGQLTKLARNEFMLLNILLNNRNKLLTREQLLNHLYNRDWHPSDRTIDVLIGKLRKYLNDYRKEQALINTVYGIGYIFAVEV
ncbi:winged helix-turn-helix domain-containing protein [Amphritea atlantica]|uniref:Winged helix-turn-helix domain-containing protein n=1 Tax=Amphritea atlantica TaxID=355243 RepID=A0ABY5GXE5_9GAMM|nr:winged helix-turn-helix domain-containing protein [Amphritea atlantica]